MLHSERKIRLFGDTWVFHFWNDCPEPEARLHFHGKDLVLLWLQRFKSESLALALLRDVAKGVDDSHLLWHFNEDHFLDIFAGMVSTGRIHIHPVPRPLTPMVADLAPVSTATTVPRWSALHPTITTPLSATSPPDPQAVVDPSAKNPNKGSKTKGNRVDLVFDPDKSAKVTKCEKIVHVQFIQYVADGVVVKPGDLWSGWKYRDKISTSDGWSIDCLPGENTPDYQQGTGDGSKNGGSRNATMNDTPNIRDFVPQGFFDPVSNKTGTKIFTMTFETYAWCMKGPDCGHWYEGVAWEYKKTYQDNQKGDPGVSTITNSNASGPSADKIAAFDKFNAEHKKP